MRGGVTAAVRRPPGRFNRAIRRFNRAVYNPLAMMVAGRRRSPYAVLRHVGRHTGKRYATPVVAHATEDGFLVALPYGDDVDWCRNILAAGRCMLRRDGVEHELVAPEVVDSEQALDKLPRWLPAFFRLFALNARKMRYLRLRRNAGPVVRALRRADLPENGVVAFDVGGTHYLVADIDGEVRAFTVVGPAVRDLDRAAVAEGRVRCPMHGWAIDPDVGRCGAADLCRYDPVRVQVDGDTIRVLG